MLKSKQPKYLTEGQAKELAEDIVRSAIRQQARDLEKHLADIDRRLKLLEQRR
jgi:predicted DNA-binding protein YlxM (UPF0122 family)|tara:strand:- start:566 stop:724 length:159 start_codon:yes stop_codon:yes gene_type:complete